MKLAIISDVHLGDPHSVMVCRHPQSGEIGKGEYYDIFKNALQQYSGGAPLDYLVLLGDILDFSVASYNDAYAAGKFFFQQVKNDNLVREMIYVPGNHDFDLWHTVEYQVNIANRILKGKTPRPFRMSSPGIIDDRNGPGNGRLRLHNVKARADEQAPRYAGLFLDHITQPPTPFNFVYPNLYLVPAHNRETILITHGQYLEAYWAILGEWALRVAGENLELKTPLKMNLREMAALNFPLGQLACIGAGQAGPLTREIQKIESEVRAYSIARSANPDREPGAGADLRRIRGYIQRIEKDIREMIPGLLGWLARLPLAFARKKLLAALDHVETSRYNLEFMNKPAVRQRFHHYYSATLEEMDEINRAGDVQLPSPSAMIFGHTHQPIPWRSASAPHLTVSASGDPREFHLYNSGGWLDMVKPDNTRVFCGAEIFFYSTETGISSVCVGH